MKGCILCLIGPSGCGKTTLAEYLEKTLLWTSVQSYTTRPKRFPEETGHTFVTEEEFDKLNDIVAYNKYNDYRYGATAEQVDNADIYVVDIPGLIELKEKYKGSKKIFVFGLYVSPQESLKRMLGRGDSEKKARNRLTVDNIAFHDMIQYCDAIVNTEKTNVRDVAIMMHQNMSCMIEYL